MKVSVRVFGGLKTYFGRERIILQLPEQATLTDLWDQIDVLYGNALPPEFWDRETKRFHRHVTVICNGEKDVLDDRQLSDGAEVFFLEPMMGG